MTEFERYLAGVRASDRMHCEADLYWRTNRWSDDGRNDNPPNKSYAGRIFRR